MDPLICLIVSKLLDTYLHRWFSKELVNYVKLLVLIRNFYFEVWLVSSYLFCLLTKEHVTDS